MTHTRWSAALLLVWGALAAPTDASKDRVWLQAQAGPIQVVSDAGEKETRNLLERMVRVRHLVQRATGLAVGDDVEPLLVLSPRTSSGMRELIGDGASRNRSLTVAMSLPSPYGHHMAVRASARQASQRVLVHEYVHVLVKDRLGDVPAWLDEGLAEFWSTLNVKEGKVVAGLPVSGHARRVRNGRFTPLPKLIQVQRGRYDQFDGSLLSFYAQSWALVHYLQLNEATSTLNLAPNIPADLAGMQSAVERYARGPFQSISLTAHDAEEITERKVAALAPARALAIRAHLMAYGENLATAGQMAQRALELEPAEPLALEVMGIVAFQRNSLDEARRWLREAVKGPTSYRAHYYYGVLTRSTPEIAVRHLRRALELRPDFTPAQERLRSLPLAQP